MIMTTAPKHFTTKDGKRVLIPSRRERRRHWREDRSVRRSADRQVGLTRQESTDAWRASWQPLRGDI